MNSNKLIFAAFFIFIGLTSCTKDDDDKVLVATPNTYAFSRNGESTVNYSGQSERIKMINEFRVALKVNTNSYDNLFGKFAHVKGANDFTDATLNASDKNIRSKVAASPDYFSANTTLASKIKGEFDTWISNQANVVFPNWEVEAKAGTAGQIQVLGGGAKRYVDAKGLELDQAIIKGLIGGLFLDQILNGYISVTVLDEGSNIQNNNNGVLETGKNYTTMEHKWDEGFGYLYGAEANPEAPTLTADSYLNGYLRQVDENEANKGLKENVYNAFKLGRAAIVAKDYTLRDKQIEILRKNLSLVPAFRGVHYLQEGKKALAASDKATAFHGLSEGFGFIYSLQFTRKPNSNEPYFTNAEVNVFLDKLLAGNGLWEVSAATLDEISTAIATRFGFTVEAAAK